MNIIRSVFLIFAMALLFSGCAAPQPDNESQVQAGEVPTAVPRLSLEESRAAFENGEALFLDVRKASSYKNGHIPGAKSIPLAELEDRIGELDPNQWIITYCT
jgi:3-mercaptopyruvate sulfurtransferase SseA